VVGAALDHASITTSGSTGPRYRVPPSLVNTTAMARTVAKRSLVNRWW
jgi:hypothetical protein